jgi:hypothetical protein
MEKRCAYPAVLATAADWERKYRLDDMVASLMQL